LRAQIQAGGSVAMCVKCVVLRSNWKCSEVAQKAGERRRNTAAKESVGSVRNLRLTMSKGNMCSGAALLQRKAGTKKVCVQLAVAACGVGHYVLSKEQLLVEVRGGDHVAPTNVEVVRRIV